MTKRNSIMRALAISSALSVVALGATTTTAHATLEPSKSQGASQSGNENEGKAKGHDKSSNPSKSGSQSKPDNGSGNSQSKGHAQSSGNSQSSSQGSSQGGSAASQGAPEAKSNGSHDKDSNDKGSNDKGLKGQGDPAGNNGTVKITPHGEVDGIPQNTPHVGCDFDVEWYGFDEGAESFVTFVAWAPTRVPMTVAGPVNPIDVGADPASGAGVGSDVDGPDADNGFDGEAHYTLSFPEGGAHPQQGYHVKLTIETTGSQGADTKHKVFWVQECETASVNPENPENPENPGTPGGPVLPDIAGEEGTDLGTEVETDIEVLGEQAAVGPEVAGVEGDQAVPSAVDAGLEQADKLSPMSTLPLMLALYGALLAGLALLVRRRTS